jgi:type 2A phosphatase activator TIP41
MLYEDELADNGIAMLSVKIRVMPARLLLLCRFFMRLDDVMFRIRDTRVYVEFATGEVIREHLTKEQEYVEVRRRVSGRGDGEGLVVMRDANRLSELLPVVDRKLDMCVLK